LSLLGDRETRGPGYILSIELGAFSCFIDPTVLRCHSLVALAKLSKATLSDPAVRQSRTSDSVEPRTQLEESAVEVAALLEPQPDGTAFGNPDGAGEHQPAPTTTRPVSTELLKRTRVSSALSQTGWNTALVVLTTGVFVVTAWFAQATFSVSSVSNLK